MKDRILSIVSRHGFDNPIGRKELVAMVGESDRAIRRIISESCPEIGQCGDGYYLCKTREDFDPHIAHIRSRIKSLYLRYRRIQEKIKDVQHSPGLRSVSAMVKAWVRLDSNYNLIHATGKEVG